MSDKIEKFLDLEADHQVEIDRLVSLKEESYKRRLEELLLDVSQRDEAVFELLEVDVETSLEELLVVPVYQRSIEWFSLASEIISACRLQAYVEIFGVEAIEQFEWSGAKITNQARKMSFTELKEASKRGIGKQRIKNLKVSKYGTE